MTDPVDEFWLPAIGAYQEKPFKSATRAGSDLSNVKKPDSADKDGAEKPKDADHPKGLDSLLAMVKLELGDAVKDVRISDRLTDSAVCLVADEGDLDIHLERLLRQHKQLDQSVARVLEINPTHPLITALAGVVGNDGSGAAVTEAAWLLLDQARILEGEALPDPAAFSRRLSDLMTKNIST
jgi:molecular chaperone HtpG